LLSHGWQEMTAQRLRALLGVVAFAGVGVALEPVTPVAASSSPCLMEMSTSTVAFCDSFTGAAAANPSRSGALNPTVWGVSEVQSGGGDNFDTGTNPSQGLVDTVAPVSANDPCGGRVLPPANIQICSGQLFDSLNDDGGQTVLAMYPRQPFDIAGRTGDVTFNVSDNSQGVHAAWPTFVFTDQPVPAPYSNASGIETSARNSFGFTMASVSAECNGGQAAVDTFFETRNYALTTQNVTTSGGGPNSGPLGTSSSGGCVNQPTYPTQQNHIEVQISQTQVVVWGSNPGSTQLVKLAELDNANLPLTRGLVWIEDAHYNADKFNTQQSNTFGWSDLGFDGPILPRDLGFDVPVEGSVNASGAEQLGFDDGTTVSTLPTTSADVAAASGALVEFTWYAYDTSVPSVALNGHSVATPSYPFPDGTTYVWRTIAIPAPLSDVVPGANQITFANAPGGFANVDLILQGAGGLPTCLDPSECGAVSPPHTPTPTPRSSPSPTPSTSGTPSPTPAPSPSISPSKAATSASPASAGVAASSGGGPSGALPAPLLYALLATLILGAAAVALGVWLRSGRPVVGRTEH
jgi:hypothetical protein